MKEWTQEELEEAGYKIENVQISRVDLSMADYCVLTLEMPIVGNGWGCVYGGRVIGQGYLGAKEFKGTPMGIEYIMRIMDIVGVEKFNEMSGKYIRVARTGWGDPIKIIGNLIKDRWFDADRFFENTKE